MYLSYANEGDSLFAEGNLKKREKRRNAPTMGFRFRKSMKILPGIRLTFGKNSIGISAGVPGARISLNSKGRITTSAGIPGSGLYWTESTSLKKKRSTRTRTEESIVDGEVYVEDVIDPGEAALDIPTSQRIVAPRAGFFSSKAEKALSALFHDIYGDRQTNTPEIVFKKTRELAEKFPDLTLAMQAIQVLHGVQSSELEKESFQLAHDLWPKRQELFSYKLVRKYFAGIIPMVQVTPGIHAQERYNVTALGLIYAEVLQIQGDFEKALEVVEEVESDQISAISVVDLEIALKRYDDAIATTEDIENEDDATAMLLIFRGIAFREKGFNEASLECFKLALAKRTRTEIILNRGLWERAYTYEKLGKKAQARKDLEKILSREPAYPGLLERLEELNP